MASFKQSDYTPPRKEGATSLFFVSHDHKEEIRHIYYPEEGEKVWVEIPHSEAAMHTGIAGKVKQVCWIGYDESDHPGYDGKIPPRRLAGGARVYDINGRQYSGGYTLGEVGFHYASPVPYVYPADPVKGIRDAFTEIILGRGSRLQKLDPTRYFELLKPVPGRHQPFSDEFLFQTLVEGDLAEFDRIRIYRALVNSILKLVVDWPAIKERIKETYPLLQTDVTAPTEPATDATESAPASGVEREAAPGASGAADRADPGL